jgi:NAD(P)-dependent dehydrogenase (short-subunit alcohol dehydrogenase family)
MSDSLKGQTMLVTGASRGIGAATAWRLGEAGVRVVRMSRSGMPALPGSVDFQVDLADPQSRSAAVDRMLAQVGTPDAVVSNAGAFLLAPLGETSDDLVREQVAINLEAPLALARRLVPPMQARGNGSHVIVGSVADARGFPGNAAYAASKYGVRGLHEVLCEEFRGSGVRFSLISPGPTDTAVWDPVDPDNREGFTRREQMLRPDDVAQAIVWVLSLPPHVQVEVLRLGAI